MKRFYLLLMVSLWGLGSMGGSAHAAASKLDELLAGAKKEGVIEFHGPSTLGPQGAQALGAAFNKKYALNVKLNYSPSGNMTRDVAKVISMAATGVTPEWDVMVVTDAHHGSLWTKKLHIPFDYKSLGVAANIVTFDNGAVIIANQFALPTYNKKILPAKDVPQRWEDLLDPKWKGGKLGVINSTHHWARLAAGPWGEEKTTDFVKKLAELKPILSRAGEMAQRLLLGEVLLSGTMQDSQLHEAAESGAPLAFAEGVQPVISPAYNIGVLKGAAHPNVGHLFAVFMTLPEGQEIWEKHTGHTSAHVKGTKAYKYAQGKNVVYMAQDKADMIDRLGREYGKILGFDR